MDEDCYTGETIPLSQRDIEEHSKTTHCSCLVALRRVLYQTYCSCDGYLARSGTLRAGFRPESVPARTVCRTEEWKGGPWARVLATCKQDKEEQTRRAEDDRKSQESAAPPLTLGDIYNFSDTYFSSPTDEQPVQMTEDSEPTRKP